MQYKVTKQYTRGQEVTCAEFKDLRDAQNFIENLKLTEDAALNIITIYRLFDHFDLVKTYDPNTESTSSIPQGSSGSESRTSFTPTPFNTAPRPQGSPHKWYKDEDEKNKDKDTK